MSPTLNSDQPDGYSFIHSFIHLPAMFCVPIVGQALSYGGAEKKTPWSLSSRRAQPQWAREGEGERWIRVVTVCS